MILAPIIMNNSIVLAFYAISTVGLLNSAFGLSQLSRKFLRSDEVPDEVSKAKDLDPPVPSLRSGVPRFG